MAVVGHWSGLLFILGTHALPGWAPGGALLLAASAVSIANRPARRSGPAKTGEPTGGASRRRRARALLTSLTVLGCLLGGLTDAAATYHLLKPAGPAGCRAIVRETAFLFAGGGNVYAGFVVGPIGVAWRGSSWAADDGYRPVAAGTYSLTWGLGGGSLIVHGTTGNPVWPALHEVDCG